MLLGGEGGLVGADETRVIEVLHQWQALHGMAELRAIPHLIEQAPNDDAGMIAIPAHDAGQGGIETTRESGRWCYLNPAIMLLLHEDA